jgi:hypothetical protein
MIIMQHELIAESNYQFYSNEGNKSSVVQSFASKGEICYREPGKAKKVWNNKFYRNWNGSGF